MRKIRFKLEYVQGAHKVANKKKKTDDNSLNVK